MDPGWFFRQEPTIQMGLVVLGLLVIASGLVRFLKGRLAESQYNELFQRIRSWWIMAGFFFFSLLIHPQASLFMFAFLSFMALKEYFTLIHTRLEDRRALFWAFMAIPIQYYLIFIMWRAMVVLFIPVYMFLFIPFRLLLTGQTKGIVDSMARIQWGLMAFVFCISHIAFLMTMPPLPAGEFDGAPMGIPGGGRALVLYLVFLTEINDVAQYVWGKLFGKHKITPTISPNKTWEGFLGGMATTMLLALALSFLSGFNPGYSLAAGFIISFSGFIGDLVISAVKRDIGVKDTGTLIPGHGGMLDRIDSLAYAAPLFFHFTNYFFYRIPW
jgi:phosphatidate cytidylyltransferase